MNKIPYLKQFTSVKEQIALLKKRGLNFAKEEKAFHFLTYHNYYSVSGYIFYFEEKASERTHRFSREIDFNEIIELIRFDHKLRDVCFKAIQGIEISLRTCICRAMGHYSGPFCYENPEIFRSFKKHKEMLTHTKSAVLKRNNEPFIKHFKRKYIEPTPPIWVVIETLSLGSVSRMYDNLLTSIQKDIAKEMQVDHIVLVSWLKALTDLRNVCAHHSRLWNRGFKNYPKIQKKDRTFPILKGSEMRLGSFIPMISHLQKVITQQDTWQEKLLILLKSNSSISSIDLGLEKWWPK